MPGPSLRMALYEPCQEGDPHRNSDPLTMITLQKLLCKSFQLLRSSVPTIWFCAEAVRILASQSDRDPYLHAEQMFHSR
jgi:hypothetical protein